MEGKIQRFQQDQARVWRYPFKERRPCSAFEIYASISKKKKGSVVSSIGGNYAKSLFRDEFILIAVNPICYSFMLLSFYGP